MAHLAKAANQLRCLLARAQLSAHRLAVFVAIVAADFVTVDGFHFLSPLQSALRLDVPSISSDEK